MILKIEMTVYKDANYGSECFTKSSIEVESNSFNDDDVKKLAEIVAGNLLIGFNRDAPEEVANKPAPSPEPSEDLAASELL